MRFFGKSAEAQPEAPKPTTQAANLEAIPPCPTCGCEMPALLDNMSICCRQYVRNWFACSAA
jgi:hypothetical protein